MSDGNRLRPGDARILNSTGNQSPRCMGRFRLLLSPGGSELVHKTSSVVEGVDQEPGRDSPGCPVRLRGFDLLRRRFVVLPGDYAPLWGPSPIWLLDPPRPLPTPLVGLWAPLRARVDPIAEDVPDFARLHDGEDPRRSPEGDLGARGANARRAGARRLPTTSALRPFCPAEEAQPARVDGRVLSGAISATQAGSP
jgi:hypothetical protein